MTASHTATVMPLMVEYLYPCALMRSSISLVVLVPCTARQRLMISGRFFLVTWNPTSKLNMASGSVRST